MTYPLSQFPLFIRAGAIIPLMKQESGATNQASAKRTFVIYPKGKSHYQFHLPKGDGTAYFDCTVSYDAASGRLTMHSDISADFIFIIGHDTFPVSGTDAEITVSR
jgi:alpha-glucosidase (family GH31 glycosyl hydrolase)